MRELGYQANFLAKAGARLGVAEQRRRHDLYNYLTAHQLMFGTKDLAHASRAEAFQNAILAENQGGRCSMDRMETHLLRAGIPPGGWP